MIGKGNRLRKEPWPDIRALSAVGRDGWISDWAERHSRITWFVLGYD